MLDPEREFDDSRPCACGRGRHLTRMTSSSSSSYPYDIVELVVDRPVPRARPWSNPPRLLRSLSYRLKSGGGDDPSSDPKSDLYLPPPGERDSGERDSGEPEPASGERDSGERVALAPIEPNNDVQPLAGAPHAVGLGGRSRDTVSA